MDRTEQKSKQSTTAWGTTAARREGEARSVAEHVFSLRGRLHRCRRMSTNCSHTKTLGCRKLSQSCGLHIVPGEAWSPSRVVCYRRPPSLAVEVRSQKKIVVRTAVYPPSIREAVSIASALCKTDNKERARRFMVSLANNSVPRWLGTRDGPDKKNNARLIRV